jgi:acyl-CoA synthetase (AMP-forming)/AMP-acid ligase II
MWNEKKYLNRIAIIDEKENKYTFKQIFNFFKKLKTNYKFSKRSLALCVTNNSFGAVFGYLFFIFEKIVPILIDSELNKSLTLKIIQKYKPKYIWAPKNYFKSHKNLKIEIEFFGFCLFITKYKNNIFLNPDLALLMTTSGTTGSKKFVKLSYENLRSNTLSIINYLNISHRHRTITTLPMSYVYGLSIINTHFFSGASIIINNFSFFQKEFWKLISKYKINSFGGVPYHYEILDRINFYRFKLPSLKYFTQAGGKISEKLQEKIAKYASTAKKKFIIMYGQAEATSRMSYLPHDQALDKIGSIGKSIPGGKFKIFNSFNKELLGNKEGELVYYGKNVFMGYANTLLELSKPDENDGILKTGDIAKKDKQNFYYIVGRKKNFVKILGNRINLDEIEKILTSKFAKINIACFGNDNKIYIVCTRKHMMMKIIKYVISKIKISRLYLSINYIKKIPRLKNKKIDYNFLKKKYIIG